MCGGLNSVQFADAKDWYVHATRGSGKEGSQASPAKDLGNISQLLAAGDRVLIAEGTYVGRAENGSDEIQVPVEILGGWSDDFSSRDAWGKHKTILTGSRNSQNFSRNARLSIKTDKYSSNLKPLAHKVLVDGIVFDQGPRNTYADETETKIKRKASPGAVASPDSSAVTVVTGQLGDIEFVNCVVINSASSQGAVSLQPGKAGKVVVRNNVAINNTGFGFQLSRSFNANQAKDQPVYLFQNNLVLFTEKYDAFAQTQGGSALKLDSGIQCTIENNILGMSDFYGIDNSANVQRIVLRDNIFLGNIVADYLEFSMRLAIHDIADSSRSVQQSSGNAIKALEFKVPSAWSSLYMARNVIDRNVEEAKISVPNSTANQIRSILGLNLRGENLSSDSDVWLPRMQLEAAMELVSSMRETAGPKMP